MSEDRAGRRSFFGDPDDEFAGGAPKEGGVGGRLLEREVELAFLSEFIRSLRGGGGGLLIEGEAGIGKTKLWNAGVMQASGFEVDVISCRAAGSEVRLSFTCLGDLLDGRFEAALAALPAPQRRALESALLLADAEPRGADHRAVGLAFLNVLRSLAAAQPLLLAVDDLQWVDEPSVRALEFALRRLRDEPVGLLATLRIGTGEAAPFEVERALGEGRLERVRLGPLSTTALHELLRVELDLDLAHPLLLRLHEVTGGNPFFALEIGRGMLPRSGSIPADERLPVPENLRQLVRHRLRALPRRTARTLLAAAALSQPTLELLTAWSGNGERVAVDIDVALKAGVVELAGDRLRFTHPLLPSVHYAEAGAAARRRIHRELAAVARDAEELARHLALARDPPDTAVALALDEAARLAHDRGAPHAAAELSEQARRFTAAGRRENVRRRLLECAEYWLEAGDTVRARLTTEEGLASSLAGHERAEALNLLGQVQLFGDVAAGAETFREAASEPGAAPVDRARAELFLATSMFTGRDDLRAAAAHAETAVRLAEGLDDPPILMQALTAKSLLDGLLGRPEALRAMERALALEQSAPTLRVLRQPSYLAGILLYFLDRIDEARSTLGVAWERAHDRGDENALAWIAHFRSVAERLAGNWSQASAWIAQGYEAAVQSGQEGLQAVLLADRSLLDAHLGRTGPARTGAEAALALGDRTGQGSTRHFARSALGLLELSLGRPGEAHRQLAPLVEAELRQGVAEPGALRYLPDEIEALVALGQLEQAERLLAPFEERAARLDRPSGLAASRRCRGLLEAAQGNQEAALRALGEALVQHDRVSQPFERARSLLVEGMLQRRNRQKREARSTLEEAHAIFDRLGAGLWAKRAGGELRRVGGRQRSTSELTPTEQRVARLVAEGRKNREVAAALFMSVRTVEWNLAKVYRKLGIRSRTELAARLPSSDSWSRGSPAD